MGDIFRSQAHRTLANFNLPYRSYTHPESTSPQFVPGSQDLMTSPKGYAERRPGFSTTLETVPTTFNNLQRVFSWNTFTGQFIQMAVDINAANRAVVYKMIQGVDNSFVSIFTDSTANVFDFVVSNNIVYFSNGNVAKKWSPTIGLENWGIAIGSVNNASGPNGPSTGANQSVPGNIAWTNPNNITLNDGNSATVTLTAGSGVGSDFLLGTGFGFSVSPNTTITGIQVDVNCFSTTTGSPVVQGLQIGLMKNGSFVGIGKGAAYPNSLSFVSFGSTSDLWGTNWTPNDVNQSTFGVLVFPDLIFSGSGTQTFNIDFIRVTVFGIGGPSISVSGSAGTFSATIGYQYVFCYGNSSTGHISSPSPASASTGVFTNKLNTQVSLTASTDPQVNQIHVYRSTDSVTAGTTAGLYFEIPTSPYTNTTQNITDNATDTSLNIFSIAPIQGINDPPTPFFGPVYFAGRVWGFKNNQLFFSGLEEIVTGVPEESFPSGLGGNFWNFDQPIQGLGIAGQSTNQQLLIFCPGRIYGIAGNSLDTFRRFLVSDRRGVRNRTCVSSLGGLVAWNDTSGQIWGTDTSTLTEAGIDIRPDLASLNPVNCSLTFHTAAEAHWLVFSTGQKLFVYDGDLSQWMPPWSVALNYVGSFEITAGNYGLIGCTSTTALVLNQSGLEGSYNDGGRTYQPIARTGLFSVVPDYSAYSSGYAYLANEPSRTAYATGLQVDTNNNPLTDVRVCVDDDPTNAATSYAPIFINQVTPQVAFSRKTQGTNLLQNVFTMNDEAEGRFAGVQITGANADDNLRLYSMFIAINPLGGR